MSWRGEGRGAGNGFLFSSSLLYCSSHVHSGSHYVYLVPSPAYFILHQFMKVFPYFSEVNSIQFNKQLLNSYYMPDTVLSGGFLSFFKAHKHLISFVYHISFNQSSRITIYFTSNSLLSRFLLTTNLEAKSGWLFLRML